MSHRIAATGLAILLTLGATAGCAASTETEDGGPDLPAVSIAAYGDVSAQLDYELAVATTPVSQFSLNSPEYVIRVLHAIAVRTDECMIDEGYTATAPQQDWSPFVPNEDRTYGIWSVSYASKYGVSLAPGAGAPSIDIISMGVEQSKAYEVCSDAAKESLIEELTWSQEMNIDAKIKKRAYELTAADESGQQARADWQACMEEQGIVLDSADGRPVQQYQEQGKEAEIGAIVVEATCAQSTGAIQTLYDLQARYEAALIDSQTAQIKEFRDRRDEVIAAFEDAIAGR